MNRNINFDALTWKCHACGQEQVNSGIRLYKHDFSKLFNMPTGCVLFNFRYCANNKDCEAKAQDRKWVKENRFRIDNNVDENI